MTPKASSADLLARIRTGDVAAFEEFFRDWYPRLAEHAAHFLGRSDAAEDAVQEVFIAVWRRREALPEEAKVAAYLHRAVRNRALNQLRSTRSVESWDADSDESVSPDTADNRVHEAELGDAVTKALATLAPRTREVFLLSRTQGRTYNEIAAALDISVKTVETLMGRALKALRAQLDGTLRTPES